MRDFFFNKYNMPVLSLPLDYTIFIRGGKIRTVESLLTPEQYRS